MSWGTKGDNKVATDLGVVKTSKKGDEVEVDVPTEQKDIDAAYEDAIHVLQTKPPKAESNPDPKTEQEDYYRSFRTKYVLTIDIFPPAHLTFGSQCKWHFAATGNAASSCSR